MSRYLPPNLKLPVFFTFCALCLALICLAYAPLMVRATATPGPGAFENVAGATPAGDFSVFYAAGRLANADALPLAYDSKALFAEYADFTAAPKAMETPFAYPPPAASLMAPFAVLPPWPALTAWIAALGLAAALSAWFATRRASGAVAALIYPGAGATLSCGQTSLFAVPSFALALIWWRTRPLLAGIALGVLIWKPHLALGAGLIALLTRQWRVVAGGIIGALGACLMTLPFVGLESWRAFVAAITLQAGLTADGELPLFRMLTAFSAARTFGWETGPALALHACAAIAGMWVVLRLWQAEALWVRAFALTISAALISPYIYDYDLGLLALPFAILAAHVATERKARTWTSLAWLALLALAPIASLTVSVLAKTNFGATVVLMLLVAAAIGPLRLVPRGAARNHPTGAPVAA